MGVTLLIWVAIVALIICVGCLVAVHIVPTGFHPLFDPVSFYGTSPYHALYQIQAIASGVSALCLVAAFSAQGIALPTRGIVFLVLYGLARVLIAAFPTDVAPPSTQHGRIHILLATIAFTSIAIATALLTPELTTLSEWHGDMSLLSLAQLITGISALLFILATLVRATRPYIGLPERGIYLGALLWLGAVLFPFAAMH